MIYPFSPDFRATLAERCESFPRVGHDGERLTRAAVALTLVEADDGSGEAAFLLTRRAAKLRAHAGQWALPGGRCDPGETPVQTALRELEEELGLSIGPETVLGLLDDYATRSGYAITPVVAWLDAAGAIRPNPVIRPTSTAFGSPGCVADEAVTFETIPRSKRPVIGLHVLDGHRIHAPTAAVVYQLRELAAGRVTRVAHLEQPHRAPKRGQTPIRSIGSAISP